VVAKIPGIVKIIYLKYSYKNETSIAFKALQPVTGCSDPSAAPPALPKIFNGNAVKGKVSKTPPFGLKTISLIVDFFLFPGMNRHLKGPLTTSALQISDNVSTTGSGAGIATSSHRGQYFEGDKSTSSHRGQYFEGDKSTSSHRGQYFEGDKSFTPARLFSIIFF